MSGPSRYRRPLKFGLLSLCTAILATWFASVIWAVPVQTRTRAWGFIVGDGGVAVWWGMRLWMTPERQPIALVNASGGTGLHAPRRMDFPDGTGILRIPFWMIIIPFAVPTAWLWWRDSQAPTTGHCRCGYDLTGNTSGVCPECGATIPKGAAT